MRIAFVLIVMLVSGCSSAEKPQSAPAQMPDVIKRAGESAQRAKENEAKALAEVQADKNGVLFPKAEEAVKKSAAEQLGSEVAAKATVKADKVEDFGDRKWKVTGTYAGPDRNGKAFTSHWTVEMDVSFGGLQTKQVSLGKMDYSGK